MSPRILIFGGGGVGALTAYLLSRVIPENNIVVACRSSYGQVAANGLTIHSAVWGHNINLLPKVVRTAEEAAKLSECPFDFVVVTTKSLPFAPSVAELIRPAVSEGTMIVLIQNGIQIEEPFHQLYSTNAILSAVAYCTVTQTSPGVFEHSANDYFHMGTYPAIALPDHKEKARAFCDFINAANATAHYHEDIQTQRWNKLLINGGENPICALSRLRDAQFFASSPGAPQAMREVMQEIASVAQATGQTSIDDAAVERAMDFLLARQLPGCEPSTMADALSGKNMEVDAIMGNVVRLAEQHNVDTPRCRLIYYLLNGLDKSFSISQDRT